MKDNHSSRLGRPRLVNGEKQTARCITLSESMAEAAKRIGNGNISSGIRIALEAFLKNEQSDC